MCLPPDSPELGEGGADLSSLLSGIFSLFLAFQHFDLSGYRMLHLSLFEFVKLLG